MVNCGGSVQLRYAEQIQISTLRRDPPLEHHATRARHGQQMAIPRGLGGVGRESAVDPVILDELGQVREEAHAAMKAGQRDRHNVRNRRSPVRE